MMSSKDLHNIIGEWPYEQGHINVRKIRGVDNRVKIQMRVDLGLLQMETEGRPDGQKPFNHTSLLEYHLGRLESHERRNGTVLGFELTPEECQAVREESLQYYQRYLANFALEDYPAVVRDTQRNLDVLDLCARYAAEQADRYAMEAYRPYILMMNVRSKALSAMEHGAYLTAMAHVEAGMMKMKAFFKEFGSAKAFRRSAEVKILKALRREIREHLPEDPIRKLKQQLADAVSQERYEEAARLRDELDALIREHDHGA